MALDISACSGVANVSSLAASCNSLVSLVMGGCAAVTDVRALSGCTTLTLVDLSSCSAVTNIRALDACKLSLNYIDVRNNGSSLADVGRDDMIDAGYYLLLPPLGRVLDLASMLFVKSNT